MKWNEMILKTATFYISILGEDVNQWERSIKMNHNNPDIDFKLEFDFNALNYYYYYDMLNS